jgi:hypothetical protein
MAIFLSYFAMWSSEIRIFGWEMFGKTDRGFGARLLHEALSTSLFSGA